MDMTSAALYGTPRPTQPTNSPGPQPSEPGSNIRTEANPNRGLVGNPTAWLVALVGLAIALIVSVRLEVEVAA